MEINTQANISSHDGGFMRIVKDQAQSNKRPANADELRAAALLKAIWETKRKPLGLSQKTLGEMFLGGVTQGAISQYLNGRTPLNLAACLEFAEILGVELSEFAPTSVIKEHIRIAGDDSESDFFEVPYYRSQRFAAGPGSSNTNYVRDGGLRYRWSWAQREGLTREQTLALVAVRARGDSMLTQIADGETLLARTDLTEVENGRIYAIDTPDGQRVKRLYLHDEVLLLVSDNPDIKIGPDVIKGSDIRNINIIGLVWNRSGRVL